jgi:peptidoglycan/xylan/chitin deacetylase (PgdA/CDA1 family)
MRTNTGRYFHKLEKAVTLVSYLMRKRRSDRNTSVPILAYHEICDLPDGVNRLHSYNVTAASFKEQMDFLHRNDYSVMKLERLISCLGGKELFPERPVILTFDDGYKNNYTNAYPVLKQYDFPATIFLATNYIGSDRVFPWLNALLSRDVKLAENWMPMSWQEVEEMSQSNIAFGSHTCSHSNIRTMNDF